MFVRRIAAIALLTLVGSSSTIGSDSFTQIHLDNQKIGSDVSAYWATFAPVAGVEVAATEDVYSLIHLANQKVGSEVWVFWNALAPTSVALEKTRAVSAP